MGDYDSPLKKMHRHAVVGIYFSAPKAYGKKVLYIDTPEGDATREFISAGIDPKHLEAVNYDEVPCTRITKQGVKVHQGDINDVIVEMHEKKKRYACIWLDTTSTEINQAAWTAGLECAYYVMGAYFISRQVKGGAEAAIEHAKQVVQEAGGFCPEAPHQYDGRSSKPNMIRVVGTKHAHGSARPSFKPCVRRAERLMQGVVREVLRETVQQKPLLCGNLKVGLRAAVRA